MREFSRDDRAKFKSIVGDNAFNAWMHCDPMGEYIDTCTESICYAGVWSESELIDELFVFFGDCVVADSYQSDEWCDWVINRSPFADAFRTKDVLEGFDFGFELDTQGCGYLTKAGMTVLRQMFEFDWDWGHFRDLGYSEMDSYVLATNYNIEDGALVESKHRTLHMLVRPFASYQTHLGEKASPRSLESFTTESPEEFKDIVMWWGGLSENLEPLSYKDFKEVVTTVDVDSFGYSESVKRPVANKENMDYILKYLGKV